MKTTQVAISEMLKLEMCVTGAAESMYTYSQAFPALPS